MSRTGCWLAGMLSVWMTLSCIPVAAQLLPGAATPGGATPVIPTERRTPEIPDESVFPIPPVIDRPLGVDTGERLFVSSFELKGANERLEQGLQIEALNALIESARIESQGLEGVGEDGFTDPERMQIAAFMRAVVEDADWDNRLDEYEVLVDRLREERLDREVGMTIGQMQEIATAVTQYYRNAGFILAQAYIPAQDVSSGVVVIEVLEGSLGNVLAQGNERFDDDILAAPFEELIDAPVVASDIESSILTLTDLPGLTVFGVFQPGQSVGTSDLVLQVQEEDPWEAILRFDNHGNRFTGQNRAFAEFTLNNPTRSGDRFTANILRQYSPDNSLFGSLFYERPVFRPGLSIEAFYSRNEFDVGAELSALELSGVSEVASVDAKYVLKRSREKNVYGRAGIIRKKATSELAGTAVARDDLSMAVVEVSFDSIDADTRSITLGAVKAEIGLSNAFGGMGDREDVANRPLPPTRISGSGKLADNENRIFSGNLSRLQRLGDYWSALVRMEGQITPDILTSTEQFQLGGPTNVRAYATSEFLMDSAFFGSLELTADVLAFSDAPSPFKNLNWSDVIKVSFFTDYALGSLHSPLPTDEAQVSLGGYGAGLSFTVPGDFTGRVQAARPFNKSARSLDGKVTRWWFDLTYSF